MLAHLRACGYRCPPVSKPCVFLCVLMCTWISMCVRTRKGWGFMGRTLEKQIPPPNLPHCPATCSEVDRRQGVEKSPPEQQ